jgi:hypothetical protein
MTALEELAFLLNARGYVVVNGREAPIGTVTRRLANAEGHPFVIRSETDHADFMEQMRMLACDPGAKPEGETFYYRCTTD